jgi:hypothetical protein
MKVSGFSFIKNAIQFDYPVKESILSILPLVDEYIIAVGNSVDNTKELITSINNPKIKIIDTIWNENLRQGGEVLAAETNKALAAISSNADWAFYLQGDECLHEKDYANIKKAMQTHLHNPKVDGLLFNYLHFYGNYNYVGTGRRWYRNEIRIIRNNKKIISWKDAQGFRFANEEKLCVKKVDANIYHYGWVKPPKTSQQKAMYFHQINNPAYIASEEEKKQEFDYQSNIDRLDLFKGYHPAVMNKRIENVNWPFEFDANANRFKNMKLKHKLSHIVEDITGYRIGEYKNYKLI